MAGAGKDAMSRIKLLSSITACHSKRFFSYRANEITGRQAAVAARLDASP